MNADIIERLLAFYTPVLKTFEVLGYRIVRTHLHENRLYLTVEEPSTGKRFRAVERHAWFAREGWGWQIRGAESETLVEHIAEKEMFSWFQRLRNQRLTGVVA